MDLYGSNPMSLNNTSQASHMYSGEEPKTMNDGSFEHSFPLAMARVVRQPNITQVYDTNAALRQGTIFPNLDKPFIGKRGAY